MKRKKSPKQKRQGSVMVLALLVVVILLVVGGGLTNLSLHSRMLGVRTSQQINARCAADAGLTKAIFEINEKLKAKPWDGSVLPQATDALLLNCDATFSYAVTGSLNSGLTIESIGNSGLAERKVSATTRLRGLFDHAIMVQETITLYYDTLVDGYNSGDPGETEVPAQIGTTSTDEDSITLKTGASVDGEILIGADAYFPNVSYPALPDMGTDIYAQGTTLTIGPSDSGKYTKIDLKRTTDPAILYIDGGDVVLYVTGDIRVGQECEIVVRADSSLTIYLDGDFTSGNESGINTESKIPNDFMLYGTGENQLFDLKAKTDWFGAVYAPNADISIKANGDTYGAFVGNSFENKAKGVIWYDGDLGEVDETDPMAKFVIERWQE